MEEPKKLKKRTKTVDGVEEPAKKKLKKSKKTSEAKTSEAPVVEAEVAPAAAAETPAAAPAPAVEKKKKKKTDSSSSATTTTTSTNPTLPSGKCEPMSQLLAGSVDGENNFKPLPLSQIDLSLVSEKTRKALKEHKNIESLFEIQARSLEPVLLGKDVVGKAKTGCGKTLAFAIPLIERLALLQEGSRSVLTSDEGGKMTTLKPTEEQISADLFGRWPTPLMLVLAPTRELANQILKDFEILGPSYGLRSECLYGGTPFGPQCQNLRDGRHILVCTPGRLLDHINRQTINLSRVQMLVLDEADEMLSMGFSDDVDAIVAALPHGDKVQKLLFSATLPSWVSDLVKKQLKEPVWIDVAGSGGGATNKNIDHKCRRRFCLDFGGE